MEQEFKDLANWGFREWFNLLPDDDWTTEYNLANEDDEQ